MPEPTAPVTAEGLRERLTETLNTTVVTPEGDIKRSTSKFDRHDRHNFVHNCAVCQGNVPAIVSTVLTTLAGDPGELIRLRNRIAALEANGAELLIRVENAEADLDQTQRANQILEDQLAEVRAERDALKAAPESPATAPVDAPVRSHLFGGGR